MSDNNSTKNNKIKQVRFDKATYFLVSNLEESCECKLWWSLEDCIQSKISALEEIWRLKTIHKSILHKDAIRLLYQPGNITYKEENFIKDPGRFI
jgi:hypothetical protein